MTYIIAIGAIVCTAIFIALYTPRQPKAVTPQLQELEPGGTLDSLTADLESVMADAVRELDICQPYITREGWKTLDQVELRKRQQARRMYIHTLEAWRKAEECVQYDGSPGNFDLRMIGSIPLARKAGISRLASRLNGRKRCRTSLA